MAIDKTQFQYRVLLFLLMIFVVPTRTLARLPGFKTLPFVSGNINPTKRSSSSLEFQQSKPAARRRLPSWMDRSQRRPARIAQKQRRHRTKFWGRRRNKQRAFQWKLSKSFPQCGPRFPLRLNSQSLLLAVICPLGWKEVREAPHGYYESTEDTEWGPEQNKALCWFLSQSLSSDSSFANREGFEGRESEGKTFVEAANRRWRSPHIQCRDWIQRNLVLNALDSLPKDSPVGRISA